MGANVGGRTAGKYRRGKACSATGGETGFRVASRGKLQDTEGPFRAPIEEFIDVLHA